RAERGDERHFRERQLVPLYGAYHGEVADLLLVRRPSEACLTRRDTALVLTGLLQHRVEHIQGRSPLRPTGGHPFLERIPRAGMGTLLHQDGLEELQGRVGIVEARAAQLRQAEGQLPSLRTLPFLRATHLE